MRSIWRLDLVMSLSAVSTPSKGSRTAFSSKFQLNLILLSAVLMGSLGAGGSGVVVGSGDTEVEVGVPTKTSGCGNKEVAVGATGELVGIDDAVGGWGVLFGAVGSSASLSLSGSSASVAVGVNVGVNVGV